MLAQLDIGGYTIEIDDQVEPFKQPWTNLQRAGTAGTYQGYDWVAAAANCLEKDQDVRIIHVRQHDETQFILPLAVEKSDFPARIRWIGNKHANIGCGLFSRQFLEDQKLDLLVRSLGALKETLHAPAVLDLKNQPLVLADNPNPLLELSCEEGPNPLFVMDLTAGFEELLKKANGRRKRRLFRQQERAAEAMGGYELHIPREVDEIRDTLNLFFELKAARLKSLGIKDVFETQEIKQMLMQQALSKKGAEFDPLQLYVLKVGGVVRAIFGLGIHGKNAHGQINAVSYDEFADHSPGEMIMYLMVRDLVERGLDYFDLGIGEERYKSSWCKIQEPLFETIYPLGTAMIPFAALKRCQTRLKKQVKSSPYLWSKVKKLRKITAGS